MDLPLALLCHCSGKTVSIPQGNLIQLEGQLSPVDGLFNLLCHETDHLYKMINVLLNFISGTCDWLGPGAGPPPLKSPHVTSITKSMLYCMLLNISSLLKVTEYKLFTVYY